MRTPLNSETLFRTNKQLYRDFFSHYPLVVSSPGGVILAGAFSHKFGGVGIHKQLPLRNYLGIQETNDAEITINNYQIYDIFTSSFTLQTADNDLTKKLDYFKQRLRDDGFNNGLKIGIMSELPRHCGLNNPGANAANLALIYLLMTNKISHQELNDFKNTCLGSVKTNYINQVVKEFHQVLVGPNNSGFGALSCFVDTGFPEIFQTRDSIVIKSLDQIFPNLEQISPYDIIIIGTSDRQDIDFSMAKYDTISENLSISNDSLDKITKSGFETNELHETNFHIVDKYRQAINASSIACLSTLGESWQNRNSKNLTDCLEAFNNSFNSLNLIGSNFKRKNKVANFIQNYFYKNLPDTPFALTTSISNNLVLITIKDHFSKCLDDLDESLKRELDFEVSWPYISWIDDIKMPGTLIDQDQTNSIYSNMLPKNSLIIKEIERLETIVDLKNIESKEDLINHYDLLLDTDDNKIYLKSRKIDSKDLPTITRTCELFDYILNSQNLKIENKHLPDISYFHDRNELQSKIISPLKSLIDKELDCILNLKINGQITDFTVSLFPSNLKIGLIKRT